MNDQISKTVRKSDMEAENRYDYGKLAFPRDGFLACTLEEAKEEIEFNYKIEGFTRFQDIKNERRDTILIKDKFLSTIANQENVESILQCLQQEYDSVTEMYQKTKVLVSRKGYRRNKFALWISSGLLLITCVLIGYWLYWIRPYDSAVIEANQDYLKKDYIAVIDAFQRIKMERLSVFDKYILAFSYIQCESLTGEQKENIMNALSLDTNEKVLDYWIYLGRLDTAMAEDIAQQISDNDLLLYAYLKDKNIVEEDRVLSGSEKEHRLEELQGKIEKITESFIKTDSEDELDISDSDSK